MFGLLERKQKNLELLISENKKPLSLASMTVLENTSDLSRNEYSVFPSACFQVQVCIVFQTLCHYLKKRE